MKLKIMKSSWLIVPGVLLSYSLSVAQTVQLETKVLQRAQQYEPALREAAAKHDVDAKLLWVIAYLETRFNPRAISHKGARGMMQFMPATAARWGLQNPHDAVTAMDAAAQYLQYLQGRFGERPELMLAGYNAGETVVEAYLTGRAIRVGNKIINPGSRRTGGIPPYAETQKYVVQGMRILAGNFQPEQLIPVRSSSLITKLISPKKVKSGRATPSPFATNTSTKTTIKSISFIRNLNDSESPSLRKQRSIPFQSSVMQR